MTQIEQAHAPAEVRLTRRGLLGGLGIMAGAAAVGTAGVPPLRVAAWAAEPPVQGAAAFDAEVPAAWFDQLQTLVRRTGGFSPPVASRAFGYAGIALYEAVAPGMDGYRSLAGMLTGLRSLPKARGAAHHWGAAANAALATAARRLWPTAPPSEQAAVAALEHSFAQRFEREAPRGVAARSVRWGRDIADAVLDWASSDGGDRGFERNFPGDYQPPQGPGLWVPTPPGFQPALQPYWGSNRPLLETDDPCEAGSPAPFSTEPGTRCHAEAVEVAETVDALTAAQREIALFWADDPGVTSTPPGHSVAVATQALRAGDATLSSAAETYVRVGIAVTEAFITCWRVKYETNVLRPITYIQSHVDAGWGTADRPLPVGTPPFPEFPSGHSVQSGAAAEVLNELFGRDHAFVDHTHDAAGTAPRSFTSFDAAAEEAAISRLYGGIHFRPAIELGLDLGRCIGRRVNALSMRG